jgi:hypothetical protein
MDCDFNLDLYNNLKIEYSEGLASKLISNNGINFLYFNGRSIRNKLTEIELLLNSFNRLIHVVIVTETWLKCNEIDFFNLNDYNSFHNVRDKQGGGVSVFCHKKITSNLILSENFMTNSHCLIINLHLNNKIFSVGAIYRPPDHHIREFIDKFLTYLTSFKNILFFGDFNINILKNSSSDVNYFTNTIHSEGFIILNNLNDNFATRVTDTNSSMIDLIVTDLITPTYKLDIDNLHFSDHKQIFLNFDFIIADKSNHEIIKISKIDYIKFNNCFASKSRNSPDTFVDLTRLINSLQEVCKSTRTINNNFKSYKKPWCSHELRFLVNQRKLYYDLSKKCPNNVFYKNKYNELQLNVTKMANENKKKYFDKKFEESIHSSRYTWSVINEVIHNKRSGTGTSFPKEIIYNNIPYTNQNDIANILNNYFGNIGSVLQLSENQTADQPTLADLNLNVNELVQFRLTNVEEIMNIINKLNSKSASGPDGINATLVKNISTDIAPIFVKLINDGITKGEFPDELKVARLVLIHKGGSKSDPNNYRAISVLPTFSKVFETIIKIRINEHLDSNNFINVNQFGFQESSNTTSAGLNLIEHLYNNIDNKLKNSALFIDVRKAFDSVDHKILLRKLFFIGFRDKAFDVLESYLSNRKQFVDMNGIQSDKIQLKCGVPQGSILGPLLFLIFVNDLFRCNFNGFLQLYADDATLLYGEKNFDMLKIKMTEDLQTLDLWMHNNKLSINFNKTNFMLFYLKNTNITDSFDYICFNNYKIDRVDKIKYLGLHLNTSLNFTHHIESVKNKISKYLGIMKKITKYVNESTMLKIYYAYIHSNLNYLNAIWSAAPEFKINELQILQNKAMKTIYKLPYFTPSISLYTENILPLHCIFDMEIILLVFKIKNKIIKCNIKLTIASEIHGHLTRYVNNLRARFFKSNCTQNSILSRGVNLFNSLPSVFQNITELRTFKKKLKEYFKECYNANPHL